MNKKPSKIEIRGDCAVVFANNTGNEFYFDIEDLHLIEGIGWNEHLNKGYLRGWVGGKMRYAHTLLINNVPNGFDIDHRDNNKKNNRRYNLRVVKHNFNNANGKIKANNTSGFKGVYKKRNKWQASIMYNSKNQYLGCFDDKIAAAKVYDAKAVELFGECALTNEKLGLL